MRLLVIALLSFAVASCWTGESLYSHVDAVAAIPSGIYRSTGPDEPERLYRVSMLHNGLTQFDGGERKEIYGFAPLDRDAFVAWIDLRDQGESPDPTSDENQIYALIVRKSDATFLIYAPECKDDGAELARKAGAAIGSGMSPTCRFATRASLEKALRLLPRDEQSALKLVRIRS